MNVVEGRTAKVWRCRLTGKTYLTKRWAYYAAAREMLRAKYPQEHEGREYYKQHPQRLERRHELFYDIGYDYHGEAVEEFLSDKWVATINRLARYLRYRDEVAS